MKVIYYQFYLFQKAFNENGPEMGAVFMLTAFLSFIAWPSLSLLSAMLYCNNNVNIFWYFGATAILFGWCYLVCYHKGEYKRILKKKPLFFNSPALSAIAAILFIVACFYLTMVIADARKKYIELHCH